MRANTVHQDHQIAWENLPWYVNGTLEGVELERLERHLESCVACRGELRYLRRLGGLIHQAEDFPLTPRRGLSEVMARIDGSADAAPPGRPTPSRSRRGRASRAVRLALLAQAAVILLLVGALAWTAGAGEPAAFRTLSDPPAAAGAAVGDLRLVFDPRTPELRLRQILAPLGAEIVAGPTPLGVYTVALPTPRNGERAARGETLDRLRRHPEVSFAEPVPGR